MSRRIRLATGALVVLAACSSGSAKVAQVSTTTTTTTTSTTTTTTTTTLPPTTTEPPTTTTEAPAPPQDGRHVMEQEWIPFAVAGDVTLHFPAERVEHVGFHESNDEGAQHIDPLPGIDATTLPDRGRGNDPQGAADTVVEPGMEIRAPVSGTVRNANAYTLYCDYTDDLVVITPDDHPGWRVKILHILGLQVSPGDRVEAGVTVIASHAHQLPFASQVDDIRTADPPWPHVHIEVTDPSIPNVPNPGSGSENCG
jgi:hypothetical protein